MKIKTMNKELNKKFEDFVKSINDEKVRNLVKQNTIITGGCIVSMALREEPNDYDLYFKDKETTLAVCNYYRDIILGKKGNIPKITVEDHNDRILFKIQSKGILKFKEDKKKKYQPVFVTSNAITLSDQIQLVIRFFGDPVTIHNNYDFEHCKAYWTSWDRKVIMSDQSTKCILFKTLKYNGSLYPLASLFRIRKFVKRGWSIDAGEIVKIAFQLKDIDLTNPKVLEDQLMGVDCSYFMAFIAKINEELTNNPEFKPSFDYVSKVLNEIFDGDEELNTEEYDDID